MTILLVLLLTVPGLATVIQVPADYPTIQDAIDASASGDTILVAPGTYVENIDFLGKAITVQSTSGAALTTIDGSFGGSVVTFESGEPLQAVLDGFTIKNGWGRSLPGKGQVGGGIYCSGASPTIRNNVITTHHSFAHIDRGGGLYAGS